MSTKFKIQLSEVMRQAWQFVKVYGFSMSEALKKAWLIIKLSKALHKGIIKFYFEKLNGEIRTAWGTLRTDLIPATSGNDRKKNESVMVYFDQEQQGLRCFKKANLISIA